MGTLAWIFSPCHSSGSLQLSSKRHLQMQPGTPAEVGEITPFCLQIPSEHRSLRLLEKRVIKDRDTGIFNEHLKKKNQCFHSKGKLICRYLTLLLHTGSITAQLKNTHGIEEYEGTALTWKRMTDTGDCN